MLVIPRRARPVSTFVWTVMLVVVDRGAAIIMSLVVGSSRVADTVILLALGGRLSSSMLRLFY